MAEFVHLHNHTMYSLLDGLSKLKRMVGYAKEKGMTSLAITDHGVMYGVVKFYQECLKAEIKPIIGCEIYITKGSRHTKDSTDKEYDHLILLAENNTGYVNLMKIVSAAWTEGYYYKPRTDLELLRQHSEGLICLSACVGGFVSEPLLNGQQQEAERRAKELSDVFGPDHFYLELQRHINVGPQERLNQLLIEMSRKLGLPVVATNDNHYTKPTDAQAQEILLCIQTQNTIDTPNRKLSMIDSPDFYLKTPDEMAELFKDIPEAIDNSVKIAERCNVEITLGQWKMPIFPIPGGIPAPQYLRQEVYKGAKERYEQLKDYDFSQEPQGEFEKGADNPQDIEIPTAEQIIRRINYELSVIEKKGYETYFLVVADFVIWAKQHGIAVGPGRGSGAGSVVSYVLTITDIDPFFFKLPFERFLNPLRPSAPDIDLDFADVRREEVIQYVTGKYGADKVAQIITFGTMEAKGAVRDVGRALGLSFAQTDRVAKPIPPGWQGGAMELDTALKDSPELKMMYDNEPETKRLIDYAKELEGVTRHASVHAAGVVIAPAPITDFAPVQREPNGGEKIVTQYDMRDVGEDGVGLLKMDFLGLRNLTIIEESIKFIKANRGIEINSSKIPYDNKKAYELLASGETTGIFQFESAGMRRYIKELKPTTIFDVSAMVALYRPGPMANIPEYIERKRNPSKVKYFDERLIDAHKQSLGMLVYQDDVLLMAITLAGYTWLDVDKFRKAMGKKIPEEMKKQEEHFIEGAQEHGKLSPERAKELFGLVAPFAGYGFNKCVTGDTLITDADTGEQISIKELYKTNKQMHVLSLSDDQKLVRQPIQAILENGVKEVFEVITRGGLMIRATSNHPFLTIHGFKELRNLKVGDRIGTARSGKLSGRSSRSTKDIIPIDILPTIRDEVYKSYNSLNAYSRQSGLSVRLLSFDAKKIGLLRETVRAIADSLNSQKLRNISESDIYWDEIVAINSTGKEMTYDLTVAENHNFVANDFIVHNSHAACYATIAYRTAYLKGNYSVEFMTALLTAESRGASGPARDEKIAQAVSECKRLKIDLLIPDINKSQSEFSIEDKEKIRFGLSAIRNVGGAALTMILEDREKHGNYSSLEDFISRLSGAAINKKTLESLIKSGAMDSFGKRSAMLAVYPEIVEAVSKQKRKAQDGQASLFDDNDELPQTKNFQASFSDVDDFSKEEKLAFEKELLGIYIADHPHEKQLQTLASYITHQIADLAEGSDGLQVKVAGFITQVKRLFTKKTGQEMAFLYVSGTDGTTIECVIFPRLFEQHKLALVKDIVVLIDGRVDTKTDRPVIVVNTISFPQVKN